MATQAETPKQGRAPGGNSNRFSWRNSLKWPFGKSSSNAPETEGRKSPSQASTEPTQAASPTSGLIRRVSRKVVPGLPRAKTFKRQQSEVREKLEVLNPTLAERRAISADRRTAHSLRNVSTNRVHGQLPRASAPDFLDDTYSSTTAVQTFSVSQSPVQEKPYLNVSDVSVNVVEHAPEETAPQAPEAPAVAPSAGDAQSITTSQYDAMIHDELERKWILNLSMHFRDKSKREKFFVTYREKDVLWRRVTISLDYRSASDDSLEKDLLETKFQREKSAKIYEAIRESLQDIQFYDTVTNLKLETTNGRLHVHVVEDINEIIPYPTLRMVQHLRCYQIPERDIEFDSHMSGFVYKVRVNGKTLIKKEIPGPDTVDEFLYEVNALSSLRFSENVIEFHGVVVDDDGHVKGLLIDYAEQGALMDVIYDAQEHGLDLPWRMRQKWAYQIVQGLSDIHEAGFVQGDFTLSNIVIDHQGNAKIIDINRRGCPVGWEPPEATPLIDSNQRISMYIGVKSDLYQLGMVLWALATLEDEPEAHRRPLRLDADIEVPGWYRRMVENCLHENPRVRLQATALLAMFPDPARDPYHLQNPPAISVDYGNAVQEYLVDGYGPHIRTVTPSQSWGYSGSGMGRQSSVTSSGYSDYYPPRGRSPPSPLPSDGKLCDSSYPPKSSMWPHGYMRPLFVSDAGSDGLRDAPPKDGQIIAETLEHNIKVINETQKNNTVKGQDVASSDSRPAEKHDTTKEEHEIATQDLENLAPTPEGGSKDEPVEDEPTPVAVPTELPQLEIEFVGETGNTEPASKGDDDMTTHLHLEPASVSTNDDADTDSGPNYTHDRNEITFTRPTEAEISTSEGQVLSGSPPRAIPSELTGVGSAYGPPGEIRQQICSDEDLGLTTTSASQNVTTQA